MVTIQTNATRTPMIDIRRGHERFHTKTGWLDSYHSFSFADHYDPANIHHGLLLVSHDAVIKIRQRGAVLWGGRLKPGETVQVPDAPHAHLYMAKGAADLEAAGHLASGDAVRLTAAGSRRLTADTAVGAEVLIWEMN